MVSQAAFPNATTAVLAQQVRHIIHQRKGVPLRRLRLSTDLNRELGFDEVDLVDIILELERRFLLTIPDEVPLRTVGDLVHYVEGYFVHATSAQAA
jgi:acyl carrier protein